MIAMFSSAAAAEWIRNQSIIETAPGLFLDTLPRYTRYCGGVAVDPIANDVYVCLNDGAWKASIEARAQAGIYRSADGGVSWEFVYNARGRSVMSGQVQVDPPTGRIAFFRVTPTEPWYQVIVSERGSRTQLIPAPTSKGFNHASVDWTTDNPQTVIGQEHEGGELPYWTKDAGATWNPSPKGSIGRVFGVIDADTFVRNGAGGIERMPVGSGNVENVSSEKPASQTMVRYGAKYYWTSANGVIRSTDKGRSWELVGTGISSPNYGPYFGNNEQSIMVVNSSGFHITTDGCGTWRKVSTWADFGKVADGWTYNEYSSAGHHFYFAWDQSRGIVYAAPSNGSLWMLYLEGGVATTRSDRLHVYQAHSRRAANRVAVYDLRGRTLRRCLGYAACATGLTLERTPAASRVMMQLGHQPSR